MSRRYTVALLAVLALAEIYLLRFHVLDDAFIHLRYAHHLVDLGRFSYNGDAVDYGSSSPLYVVFLAAVSVFTRSPVVPKVFSIVAYALLWFLVARQFLRPGRPGGSGLAGVTLAVLTTPFGVRWLTDGMETSTVALAAVLMAVWTSGQTRALTVPTASWGFALGMGIVLLRVELVFLLAVGVGATMAGAWTDPGEVRWYRRVLVAWLPTVGGAATSVLLLGLEFGHLLPDTAVAKQAQAAAIGPLVTLRDGIAAHVGSSLFGVGLFLVWVFSLVAGLRRRGHEERAFVVTANVAFPVFLCLVAVRGQALQGIRYFVFLYAYLITLNVLQAEWQPWRLPPRLGAALCVGLAGWSCFDAYLVAGIAAGRSQTWHTFRSRPLESLRGREGIAFDIGFVGFFSGARILDGNGLVNGRSIAAMRGQERLTLFAREPTEFVFGNEEQLRRINAYVPLSRWSPVLFADFPNARRSPDRHWLLVRPDLGARMPR